MHCCQTSHKAKAMESIVFILSFFFSSSSSSTISIPLFPNEARPTKSGYLPVDGSSKPSAALFFAFYEAQQALSPLPETPLLLWLQGGPGCSSMTGNFIELGPFLISPDSPTLRRNPASWNRRFGLLFIDNPVGTGFSTAPSPAAIPRNQSAVAAHLIFALRHFLASGGPSFASRPLYITGESYAGKYVPAVGYHILHQNAGLPPADPGRINLHGVAIGNGLTHPVAQVATHADQAYFAGLLDEQQKAELEELQMAATTLALAERWPQAADARGAIIRYLSDATGLATLYDMTAKRTSNASRNLKAFLNEEEARAALGVEKGAAWESCSTAAEAALHADVMKSAKFMVEKLVGESKVLLYTGMNDLRDGVAATRAWIKEMRWEGLGMFMVAKREVWRMEDGELAGFVQRWGSLSHVVVHGAGHLVPAAQGRSAQAMIEDWVMEKGLFGDA